MKRQTTFTTLTLAAMSAAVLSTSAFAQEGPGRAPMFPFETVDADKDGKVTLAELDAFRAAEAAAMDSNADGKLTAEELTAGHLARMTERAADMAAKMVARHDTDGDGALTAAEMNTRPVPAMLFEKADADGDGAVTQAEFDTLRDQISEHKGGRHGKGGHHRQSGWGMMGDN